METIYQVRIWCSDDCCEEFWFEKELSSFYMKLEDAQTELQKYEGKTSTELEKMCNVISVRNNKPYIVEYNLFC